MVFQGIVDVDVVEVVAEVVLIVFVAVVDDVLVNVQVVDEVDVLVVPLLLR